MTMAFFNPILLENAVRAALDEDLGLAGDITTHATIPAHLQASAVMVARKGGVMCGLPLAEAAFRLIDPLLRFEALVEEGADFVLLDNMSVAQMREAVKIAAGKVKLEASGGINKASVKEIAETGVDLISSGALTHSAPILDLGLDIEMG